MHRILSRRSHSCDSPIATLAALTSSDQRRIRDERARAKALLRSSLMMGLESPGSRIEAAAGQLFIYGALMAPEEILNRIDAISLADLKRCAARALEGPCAASIVGPGDVGAVAAMFNTS